MTGRPSSSDYDGVVETAQVDMTGEAAKTYSAVISSGKNTQRDRAAGKAVKAASSASESKDTRSTK